MKTISKILAVIAGFGLIGMALIGCGHGAGNSKAFQSAPAEAKALWESALSAAKTNDYAGALLAFHKLSAQPGLTPEQTKALEQTATATSDRMYAAANKGDPQAKQALQDLRKALGR